MKRWKWTFLLSVLILFVSGTAYLYQYVGLKYFVRARAVINEMPPEQRTKAWASFRGSGQKAVYRGILAGSWRGRVWVWGRGGLRSFVTDQYSIYSWFDGCSAEVRARLNAGEANVIGVVRDIELDNWREKAQVGDYVAVMLTKPGQGGKEGNLRELYDYNFWLFMSEGIDSECAK